MLFLLIIIFGSANASNIGTNTSITIKEEQTYDGSGWGMVLIKPITDVSENTSAMEDVSEEIPVILDEPEEIELIEEEILAEPETISEFDALPLNIDMLLILASGILATVLFFAFRRMRKNEI